jgi:hypothetical protein
MTLSDGELKYASLVDEFSKLNGIEASQMFGKPCLKVGGKAFVAHQKELLAFKLDGIALSQALELKGAKNWDPSGAGRPMKEWAAIPAIVTFDHQTFAKHAMNYVKAGK